MKRKAWQIGVIVALLVAGAALSAKLLWTPVSDSKGPATSGHTIVEYAHNPLLEGTPGAWDEKELESPAVIQVGPEYFMYYHAASSTLHQSYRIGLAIADYPGGPWHKYSVNPILSVGPVGTWDDAAVAVGHVEKLGNMYLMWYMGQQMSTGMKSWPWRVGLATASNPRGPWTKYEGNPVLDVGTEGEWDSLGIYVGSVAKVGDELFMWYVGFKNKVDGDGQLGLAVAPNPEGPWQKSLMNPVMRPGEPGSWNGAQIGETAVWYKDGVFHAWYAGYPQNDISQASIGYATSQDGIVWNHYYGNPVLGPGKPDSWNGNRVSEPHVLVVGERGYLFVTGARGKGTDLIEALGMACLSIHCE